MNANLSVSWIDTGAKGSPTENRNWKGLTMERLDKYLSDCGAGTRSQVKGMIKAGRVTVDGKPEKDPGRKVGAETVCLDGQPLKKQGRRVILLNKPEGFVTATEDRVERTVMELLPREYQDLKPVGRLDKATEGLLLFTDDGDLLHRLISPKKKVPKVYYARHEGTATAEDVQAFRQGLTLGDGTRCLEADLEILGPGQCHVTVYEGKYHQVRRMLASRGLPVTYLERIREGELTLGDLPRGQVRPLTDQEIENLDA
ncbi:MAG: rRNA pseudouridine synthase [Ruminococcaceae bacterium]|nr:rRNA pseudouridine synthase [Oscillospiraceae bacterium]